MAPSGEERLLELEPDQLEQALQQLESAIETEKTQLAPQEASVSQAKARYDQLARQLGDLQVKSDMTGLLQIVSVEVGQQARQLGHGGAGL